MKHDIVRTHEVLGKEVKSIQFETLGEIKEIVLDKLTGQVRYVVLAFGGFLGMGEDYFAFPWNSLYYHKGQECFILNVEKEKLKKEHGFDKNNWPDMAKWQETVGTYYL